VCKKLPSRGAAKKDKAVVSVVMVVCSAMRCFLQAQMPNRRSFLLVSAASRCSRCSTQRTRRMASAQDEVAIGDGVAHAAAAGQSDDKDRSRRTGRGEEKEEIMPRA